jgi:hypothetical protein
VPVAPTQEPYFGHPFVSVAGLPIDYDTPQRRRKKKERRKELMLQIRMAVLSGLDFWKV